MLAQRRRLLRRQRTRHRAHRSRGRWPDAAARWCSSAGHRRHRTAGRIPQQRPAWRAAGFRGAAVVVWPCRCCRRAHRTAGCQRRSRRAGSRPGVAGPQGHRPHRAGQLAAGPGALLAELRKGGLRVHTNVQDVAAVAGRSGALEAVEWRADGMQARVDCDALLQSTGWMPALQLLLARGGTLRFDARLGQHLPDALPRGVFVAGRANGCFDFDARVTDGQAAGERAAQFTAGHASDCDVQRTARSPQSFSSRATVPPRPPARSSSISTKTWCWPIWPTRRRRASTAWS